MPLKQLMNKIIKDQDTCCKVTKENAEAENKTGDTGEGEGGEGYSLIQTAAEEEPRKPGEVCFWKRGAAGKAPGNASKDWSEACWSLGDHSLYSVISFQLAITFSKVSKWKFPLRALQGNL